MPRSKRSLQEEVDMCNARATQAAEKAETKKVALCLRLFPGVSRPLWEKLQSLGYTDEKIKQTEKAVAEAEKEARSKKSLKPELAEGISDPIPERVLHLEEFDNRTLRDTLLPSIEPASLSGANLRAVEKRAGGKSSLLKILTYLVGLDSDYRVCGHLRSWSALLAALKERSELRGRRGRELILPVDWVEQGLYGIEDGCSEGVRILHRATQASRTIPWEEVPTCASVAELTIVQNWSESKAALSLKEATQGGGIEQVLLAPYFPLQIVDMELVTPPSKKGKWANSQSVKQQHPLAKSYSTELAKSDGEEVKEELNSSHVADGTGSGENIEKKEHCSDSDDGKVEPKEELGIGEDPPDFDESMLECPPPAEQ
eukprot:6491694-Amphidinium_carterae.2